LDSKNLIGAVRWDFGIEAFGVWLVNAEVFHPLQCVPDRLWRGVDAVFVAVKVNGRDLLRKRVRGRPVQISLLNDNLGVHGVATSDRIAQLAGETGSPLAGVED
jgi:hypothetical protein